MSVAAAGRDPGVLADADAKAVDAAVLTETLASAGPFTLFAPTDDAFGRLPEGMVEGLLGDIPTLTDVLLYYLVEGEVGSEAVITLSSATIRKVPGAFSGGRSVPGKP